MKLSNSFAALPSTFFTRLMPTPLPAPYLVAASGPAAALIGVDLTDIAHGSLLEVFAGNRIIPHSQPLAAVYSGHQFGVWAGQLGDGRAILLGEIPANGTHDVASTIELQLKGSGMTPYSRMGDGRAVLRSSLREFLCSEAMVHLGIPSTRALCVVGSNHRVMRESPETTAVVTRMAPSFVRFGSFEHWFYQDKKSELKILADYVIKGFYPDLRYAQNPYFSLLAEVTKRTAHMIAYWQAVGFMHGVMNSDNMSILGLTLDYGPFGFMEAFDANHICNHTDQQGRYSYRMQPEIGHWNCYALAQALLPLIGDVEEAQAALSTYTSEYTSKYDHLFHEKLGMKMHLPGDSALFDDLFTLMQNNRIDFPLFFRRLGELQLDNPGGDEELRNLLIDRPAFDAWAISYRLRLKQENSKDEERRLSMHAVNPKYVLRNYLAQIAIEKAQNMDFSETQKLLAILEKPFDEQPENTHYAQLPPDWADQLEVSCSS